MVLLSAEGKALVMLPEKGVCKGKCWEVDTLNREQGTETGCSEMAPSENGGNSWKIGLSGRCLRGPKKWTSDPWPPMVF